MDKDQPEILKLPSFMVT